MQTKNFTKIIQDQTGGNHKIKKEDYLDSGEFPIIDQGQQFIGGYTNEKGLLCKVELPCIIFGDHTRIFKYIDFPFAMGADGVKVLKCNDELDTKYAYFFLKQTKLGGKQGYNRNFKYLKEVNIPLPPLATQRAIADKLDKLQSLIDLKKQAITKTDELAKSIFLDMFGDPMKNEKGREIDILDDICDVRDGTHDSPKYVLEGYPLITSKNIKEGTIDFADANLISEEDYEKVNRRSKVDDGDILMPMIGTIGNPIIVNKDRDFAIKNVALIKFNNDKVINVYLLALLKSHYFDSLVSNNRGGTQKFVALSDIRNFKIPLPPLPFQQKFADIITQIEAQKSEHKLALAKLEELYQAEMQKSFSL